LISSYKSAELASKAVDENTRDELKKVVSEAIERSLNDIDTNDEKEDKDEAAKDNLSLDKDMIEKITNKIVEHAHEDEEDLEEQDDVAFDSNEKKSAHAWWSGSRRRRWLKPVVDKIRTTVREVKRIRFHG